VPLIGSMGSGSTRGFGLEEAVEDTIKAVAEELVDIELVMVLVVQTQAQNSQY